MASKFKPDTKNRSGKRSAFGQKGDAAKHFAGSANEFFRKPAVVFLTCFLFFGLTVWAFVPVLHCDFQYFDDAIILVNNPHVNTGLSWQNLYWALTDIGYVYSYPLARISHMADFEIYADTRGDIT